MAAPTAFKKERRVARAARSRGALRKLETSVSLADIFNYLSHAALADQGADFIPPIRLPAASATVTEAAP